ncbi:hypothetical protein ACFQFH_01120 [Halobaculum halobium]|uniref:Intracellular proteinase inhibitor n=1 Tax=Halobaculum halobium TaxID=3032281 RepID=A0ABD5TA17_9EURY|nr:hypothetical protein [Halobaculum sp. SYNS20]
MRRRALLAALAGAGALTAGCLRGGDADHRNRRTDASTATTATTGTLPASELRVDLDAIQPALVELDTDYYRLVAGSDRQYLVLSVSVDSGSPPSRSALRFRFDGEEYAPWQWEQIPARQSKGSGDEQYTNQMGTGWVAFDLPAAGDASDAALVWPAGTWRPDEQMRRLLAEPAPTLTLDEWRVPGTVSPGGTTVFEFAVRNDGEVPGWFVGGVNADGWYPHRPVAHLSRRVPPGETVTWEVAGEPIDLVEESWSEQVGDGEPDVEYELVWPGGNRRRSVRVAEAERTTGPADSGAHEW